MGLRCSSKCCCACYLPAALDNAIREQPCFYFCSASALVLIRKRLRIQQPCLVQRDALHWYTPPTRTPHQRTQRKAALRSSLLRRTKSSPSTMSTSPHRREQFCRDIHQTTLPRITTQTPLDLASSCYANLKRQPHQHLDTRNSNGFNSSTTRQQQEEQT